MAFALVAAAYGYNYGTTLNCSKPSGTAEGDLMIWVGFWGSTTSVTNPSGWTFFASETLAGSYVVRAYYKMAGASEPASYDWSSSGTTGRSVTIVSYRGGFDSADPIDGFSDVGYVTENTTIRAGGVTATAANSPVLMLCSVRADSGTLTTTKPTALDNNWVEDSDNSVTYHGGQAIYHCIWSGSGASGNVDATYAQNSVFKHAYLVILNPSVDTATFTPKSIMF